MADITILLNETTEVSGLIFFRISFHITGPIWPIHVKRKSVLIILMITASRPTNSDGQTDGSMDSTVHRAAWSQLKRLKLLGHRKKFWFCRIISSPCLEYRADEGGSAATYGLGKGRSWALNAVMVAALTQASERLFQSFMVETKNDCLYCLVCDRKCLYQYVELCFTCFWNPV